MNRLQKKCFIASTGLHLLLVIVLLIGPAFLSSSSKPPIVQPITFIPWITRDDDRQGGGNPNVQLPAALTAQQQTRVVATRQDSPARSEQTETPSLEPAQHRVRPNLQRTVRRSAGPSTPTRSNAGQRESDDRAREIASAIGNAVQGIRGGLAGSTTIELRGPGGGGVPYGNWLAAVVGIYQRAWIVPDGVTQEFRTVRTFITIARDGKVIRARMQGSSGIPDVDASIQATLDRITQVPPLPDTAKETTREIVINFNQDKTG